MYSVDPVVQVREGKVPWRMGVLDVVEQCTAAGGGGEEKAV